VVSNAWRCPTGRRPGIGVTGLPTLDRASPVVFVAGKASPMGLIVGPSPVWITGVDTFRGEFDDSLSNLERPIA